MVPRSGCSMISATINANTGSTGISSARSERSVCRRAASTCAIQSNSATLAISLGWKEKPPKPSQLRAPFSFMPIASTAASSPMEISTAGKDSRRTNSGDTRAANTKPASPSSAKTAWFSKVEKAEPVRDRKALIDDAESTISSPKPSSNAKIASTRCQEVIGRSSQSLAVRRRERMVRKVRRSRTFRPAGPLGALGSSAAVRPPAGTAEASVRAVIAAPPAPRRLLRRRARGPRRTRTCPATRRPGPAARCRRDRPAGWPPKPPRS